MRCGTRLLLTALTYPDDDKVTVEMESLSGIVT